MTAHDLALPKGMRPSVKQNARALAIVAAVVVSIAAVGGCRVPTGPVVSTAPFADPTGQRCGVNSTVRGVADAWPDVRGREDLENGQIVAEDIDFYGPELRSTLIEFDPTSGHRRTIAELLGTHNPFAVSPDGRSVASVEYADDVHAFGTKLKLISMDSSSAEEVFSARESVSALSWSPGSTSLAFIADQRLRRFDLADRSVQEIADASTPSFARGFHQSAWSPEGSWIVFTTSIYNSFDRVAPDGSGHVSFAEAHSFSWSPDGAMLAFAGDGISIARPDGSDQRELIAGPVAALSWSPDGRAIAFASSFGYETGAICVIEADGRLTTVAECGLTTETPIWSPDSSSIVFAEVVGQPGTCEANANYRLASMRREGGTARPIADLLFYPTWLPKERLDVTGGAIAEHGRHHLSCLGDGACPIGRSAP